MDLFVFIPLVLVGLFAGLLLLFLIPEIISDIEYYYAKKRRRGKHERRT